MYLAAHPLCAEHLRRGQVVMASDVDHIIPKRHGGTDDEANLQALCHACHSRKTSREATCWSKEPVRVVIVAGCPASGKSTWVRSQMGDEDVAIDVDAIAAALSLADAERSHVIRPLAGDERSPVLGVALDVRDFLIERMMRQSAVRTWWLITSEPDADKRAYLAKRTMAAQVVVIETPAAECVRRVRADARRRDQAAQWERIIADWWRRYERNDGEIVAVAG
jgi:predicted kinase